MTKLLAPVLAGLGFFALGPLCLNAQITAPVRAHIAHSFMVGDKTLPPGDYTFRLESNTNQGAMEIQNHQGDNVAQFNVRQSIDNRRPQTFRNRVQTLRKYRISKQGL